MNYICIKILILNKFIFYITIKFRYVIVNIPNSIIYEKQTSKLLLKNVVFFNVIFYSMLQTT